MHGPLHITHLFVVSESVHRFHFNIHITILYPAPNVTLIFLFHLRIICNNDFPIIIHILIRLFTSFILVFVITVFIVCHRFISIAYAILFIELRFHNFKFIHFSTFAVTNLSPCLGTLIIPCQEVWIYIDHFCIILDGAPVVTCLGTKQSAIKCSHHIVRFNLKYKIKVLDSTVVVPYLRPEQAPVIVSDKVVRINIESQVIVTHSTAQIVLVEACQSTVNIVSGIFSIQMCRVI